MDLLGSILNSMDKPPTANEEKKEQMKKFREQEEKLRHKQREELNRFRKYAEERIGRFLNDDRKSLQFQPLDRAYRTIIHDIAETNKLMTMGFGVDGLDRYIVVYKKEHYPPSDDEIAARKDGEVWNEETAKKYAAQREELKRRLEEEKVVDEKEIVPHSNYKDKYVHLIGQDSAEAAAKRTEMNKSYGFVPSENKKDHRSIEQTMADIQAKKRLKIQHQSSSSATAPE